MTVTVAEGGGCLGGGGAGGAGPANAAGPSRSSPVATGYELAGAGANNWAGPGQVTRPDVKQGGPNINIIK